MRSSTPTISNLPFDWRRRYDGLYVWRNRASVLPTNAKGDRRYGLRIAVIEAFETQYGIDCEIV